jgi:hypothetical protein
MDRRFSVVLSTIFIIIFLPVTLAVTSYQVGVSPPIIDLGIVEPGVVYSVKFNIVTPSEEPLLVKLEAERSNLDFFTSKYANLVDEYSEEDVTGWVSFIENPVQLSVSDSTKSSVSGQKLGWREVSFLLQVPGSAEPGYHSFKINPIPSVPQEIGQGADSRIVAISSVSVVFRVPGEARRSGQILDVTQGGYVGSGLQVNTYFKNTGTVTISAIAKQSFVNNGTLWQDARSPTILIKPGETGVLSTFMNVIGAEYGFYEVDTKVTYTTGSASSKSGVVVEEKPEIVLEQEQSGEGYPIWIIIAAAVVAVIVISILIYKWYR